MLRHRFACYGLAAAMALTVAGAAGAATERFSVLLGGRTLGTLSFDSGTQTILTVLDNTPLGVGDGRSESTARTVRASNGDTVIQYIGRKSDRVISVLFDGARAIETVVEPASERTEMSDVSRVPEGVLNMVAGFERIIASNGCPSRFAMYDGRRVIDVQTTRATPTDGGLTCELAYRVTAGPGHMSPFRFSNIAITLQFTTAGGQRLQQATIEAGVFTVDLVR